MYGSIPFLVGNHKLLADNNVSITGPLSVHINRLQQEAKTVIFFAKNQKLVGVIAIGDKIKNTSAEAINTLKGLGINVYMLTGDNKETAQAIADE